MNISICFPTRERPDIFMRLCQSALDTASHPDEIEFVTYHDHDDKSEYKYIGNHKEVTGVELAYPNQMVNQCYEISEGDIVSFGADDFVFKTVGWDDAVMSCINKYEDRIAVACPNNSDFDRWGFGTTGFIHKNWFWAVGHYAPTVDGSQGVDRWYHDIGIHLGRYHKLTDVYIEHENVRDDVHVKKNEKGRAEKWSRKYFRPEALEQRNRDIKNLQNFICDRPFVRGDRP